MEGTVRKDGKKWTILDTHGQPIFKANTRVECFRYASIHNIKITKYQHGGK